MCEYVCMQTVLCANFHALLNNLWKKTYYYSWLQLATRLTFSTGRFLFYLFALLCRTRNSFSEKTADWLFYMTRLIWLNRPAYVEVREPTQGA